MRPCIHFALYFVFGASILLCYAGMPTKCSCLGGVLCLGSCGGKCNNLDKTLRNASTAQRKRLMHTHAFAGKEVHQALDIPKSGIFTGKLTRVQKTLKDTPKCPNFDRFGMDFEFFLLDFWLLLCGFNSLINQKIHPTLGQYVCIYVYLCEYPCAHAHNHCHNCKMCFPHHWLTASGHPVLVLTLREPRYFS